jgi:hypothetical protein
MMSALGFNMSGEFLWNKAASAIPYTMTRKPCIEWKKSIRTMHAASARRMGTLRHFPRNGPIDYGYIDV